MKWPQTLKIGGHTVSVELVEMEDLGDSELEENRIRINKDATTSQQEAALWHEIFHFLNPTLDDDTTGHALIDSLSEQLYQVLKDNGMLR